MKSYLIQTITLLTFFLLVASFNISGVRVFNDFEPAKIEKPRFYKSDSVWVDSVLSSLSLDEKIAQLLMIAAYPEHGEEHTEDILRTITRYNVGGIIFFQGGPLREAVMTNRFQAAAKTPLLISIDGEWGLAMRLDSTISYPRQMMLGAIGDDALVYQMGFDIGSQMKRLGLNINFAPVVDVNNNPSNPVINSRSFGENRMNVARKGLMYAMGLQDAGILPVYKHFPGHGDTDTDSHLALPVIRHDFSRLDSIELFPFKFGIRNGIPAIMTAHLHVPALDTTSNIPSSLSRKTIGEYLKGTLGYEGLVITDALNMKGASDGSKPGDLEAEAFVAGNDILLMPADIPRAIAAIKRELKKGTVTELELDRRCRKILHVKAWAGLRNFKPVKTDSLVEDLNDPFYNVEKRKLIRNALTLVRNRGKVIPFQNLETYQVASLAIGNGRPDAFSSTLGQYTSVDTIFLSKDALPKSDSGILERLSDINTLIVSIQNTSQWPAKHYGITPEELHFIDNLNFNGNLVLVVFGNPYLLNEFNNRELDRFDAIVMAYNDESETKELTAQALFGASELSGTLPVSCGPGFASGTGIYSPAIQRLSYGIPEETGLDSRILMRIDSIAAEAINIKATPGCQVVVGRHGEVVFNKSYGYFTYGKEHPVENDDLYDMASLTKIFATLPSLMKLSDEGKFSINKTLGDYLSMTDSCNKKDLPIRDILTHQSGLLAWIPFYINTLEPMDTSEQLFSTRFSWEYPYKMGPNAYANRDVRYIDSVYADTFSLAYPIKVAKNMYLRQDYTDTIYNDILKSELMDKSYRYSDLGYYLFMRIIEQITDTALYPYVYHTFYSKIGASTLGYLPLNRFPAERIAPTENDILFRRQLLQGYVHDPGAAMLGGVSGHAGLFSNANDLAKVMQMYLNGGTYGGKRFLSDSVVHRFTSRVCTKNDNRRGLGFDKPEPIEDKIGPTCHSASLESFGHTGFTGTMAWADPRYDIVYIFLSNRINPDQYNNLLVQKDIRTRIQQTIYDALINPDREK